MSFAVDFSASPSPQGARLVAVDGRALPLVAASLDVVARGGLARVVLTQTFRNPWDESLTVHYSLPLPHDGAVSGFEFVLGQDRVVGEIDCREEARARYEEALATGRSAALLEQDRASLFTQEIANVPPGTDLVARITVDQRLRWRDEGAWEWRFPTVVAPRYLGAEGRVPDADRIMQVVADGPLPLRMDLALRVRDRLAENAVATSPSHAIATSTAEDFACVCFASADGARLDRDVVVRWPVSGHAPGLTLDLGRPAGRDQTYGLLTVVPPRREHAGEAVRRDVILLLDTSGSMSGAPLAQLQRVASAVVDTLVEGDTLEMIEFSRDARRWRPHPAAADDATRHDAQTWIARLRAGGGTEMRAGIAEALRGLRADAQRQVVLMTDGLIGFETEVVRVIARGLPAGSRVHTVGIGSAVNRSLTGPAARAGRGVEVVLGYGEDPTEAARTLTRRTDAPLLVDLALAGSALVGHTPRALPDLFAYAPAQVAVELRPEGGELVLRGRTAQGAWEQRVSVPPCAPGTGAAHTAALYARERVEDLETDLAAGAARATIDGAIEALGLAFQIATRRTSWVAVRQTPAVDPQAPSRRVRMPHELPDGMSAEGLGLRAAQGAPARGGIARWDPVMKAVVYEAPRRAVIVGGGGRVMARPVSLGSTKTPPTPRRAAAGAATPETKKAALRRAHESFRREDDEELPTFFRKAAPSSNIEDEADGVHRSGAQATPAEASLEPIAPFARGRVLRQDGRTITLEITAPAGGMDWDPAVPIELHHADGRVERVRAYAAGSTRAGTVGAGLAVLVTILVSDKGLRVRRAMHLLRADGSVQIIAL